MHVSCGPCTIGRLFTTEPPGTPRSHHHVFRVQRCYDHPAESHPARPSHYPELRHNRGSDEGRRQLRTFPAVHACVLQFRVVEKIRRQTHEYSSARWVALQKPADSEAGTPGYLSCLEADGTGVGQGASLSPLLLPTKEDGQGVVCPPRRPLELGTWPVSALKVRPRRPHSRTLEPLRT